MMTYTTYTFEECNAISKAVSLKQGWYLEERDDVYQWVGPLPNGNPRTYGYPESADDDPEPPYPYAHYLAYAHEVVKGVLNYRIENHWQDGLKLVIESANHPNVEVQLNYYDGAAPHLLQRWLEVQDNYENTS